MTRNHAVRVLLALLTIVTTLTISHKVEAQPLCVPDAVGVPGQPGPPTWWSGTGPIGDPRWQGSMSYGHVNDDAQFRALRYTDGGQTYLVLSWQVKVDSGPSAGNQDILYVGFWDDAASAGHVLKIARNITTTIAEGTFAGTQLTAEMRYRNSGTGGQWSPITALPPVAPWLSADARLGTTCASGLCTNWDVRLRIPFAAGAAVTNPSAGLPLPANFRMWYELRVENAGPSITRYKWPETAASVAEAPVFTTPDPSTWSQVSTASGSCATGVSLDYAQITTGNTNATEISTVQPNVFHARPLNSTGAPIAGNALRARFRIANWGSVLFDSPEWLDIIPSAPSCATATGAAGNVASGSNFDLSCSWTLSADQQCAYRPDVHNTCSPMPVRRNAHQCILVELSSTTGVVFSRASAWNNMQFVTTSRYEGEASVSIAGLSPLPSTPTRDVYLYLTTQNMPLAPTPGQDEDEPNPDNPRNPDVAPAPLAPKAFLPVGTKEGARLREQAQAGRLSQDELASRLPSYVVHVYYDTGTRETVSGVDYVVLASMPSFGYYAMHDGEITGWKHELSVAGAIEIVPNFFKVPVTHGGSVAVKTVIETVDAEPAPPPTPTEPPPPPLDMPWWIWLAILLIIAALLLMLRKRST